MDFKTDGKDFIKKAIIVTVLVLIIINFNSIVSKISNIYDILFPLIIGFVIAYIMNIIIKILERYYFPNTKNKYLIALKKPICLLISFLLILLVLILVSNLIIPQVIKTITELFDTVPTYVDRLIKFADKHKDSFPIIENFIEKNNLDNIHRADVIDRVVKYIKENWGGIVSSSLGIITGIGASIFNLVIAIFFSIYLLLSKETLVRQLRKIQYAFMKEEKVNKFNQVLAITNETFSGFIAGQFTEALVLGTLCTVGMLVFKFPYATSVGVFVGVTSLIPIIGAFIGGAVGILLIIPVDPVKALLFIVFLIALQQLEGNLIYPKIVGSSIGLPSIWVFTAVTVGGGIGGIVGMMISVPVFATVYKLLRIETSERLDLKNNNHNKKNNIVEEKIFEKEIKNFTENENKNSEKNINNKNNRNNFKKKKNKKRK